MDPAEREPSGARPELFAARRRGARISASLLAGGALGVLLLMRTMTDDVHRLMFALLGVALAVAAIVVVVLTAR